MLTPSRWLALTGVLLVSVCATPAALAAYADPSGRVARLNDVQGDVSYSPAGEDEWRDVVRNRPLIRGDRLWTDREARAELQVGNAAIRLGPETSLEILDLNDRIVQVRLTQGTLNLRVPRLYPGQSYEVATPTLAFTVTEPGRYRIDVDEHDDQTTIVVWEGAGEAEGDRSHFPLRAGDTVRFYGDDLRDHDMYGLPRADAFDRYCLDRDRRLDRSASRRYVDDDVVGYADLDDYGRWRPVRGYGTVWFPSRVDAAWAPYRDGHWAWQEPWGWTWIDDAPWGFAPSHYGRWVHVSSGWGWMPGPHDVRPVYAPALVAFIGGNGWSVSISSGQSSPVGWFPLAPREVYVPSYPASREYFTRVNVNNTVVNNITITNVYNNNYGNGNTNVTQVNYANRTVVGAVTAVPAAVFVNAQPVRPAAIRVEGAATTTGEITRIAPVAPSQRSVLGQGNAARARPSREAQERRVFARSAPPPAERPFAAREQQLQQKPGQAPEPAAVQSEKQNVRVIAEQPGAVDARAAGSSRGEGRRAARAGGPRPLQPLERPAAPSADNGPAVERQRKAESEQQAAKAAQVEQQRKADSEQQGARAAQAEQQRKAESEQQGARAAQAEQQRKADSEQQGARAAQVEQQRKADAERQDASRRQQEQRQRPADTGQQAARAAQLEQQRKADSEQQAARAAQVEQQRKADSEQQAARAAQVEQQRKAGNEQQGARAAQVEQQRKADSDQKATDAALAEQQRKVASEKQAECVRQAREKHQDERPCASEPSRKRSGKRSADEPAAAPGAGRSGK